MEHIERYQWAGVHQEPTLILLRSSLQSSSMCSSCMDTTRWNWRSRLGGGWPLVMMMLALSVNLAPLFILVAVAPNQKSNTLSLHDFHLGHDGTMMVLVIGNQLLLHDLPVHFPAALLHLRTIMHLCHRYQNLKQQDSPYTSECCIYCELDSQKPRVPTDLQTPLDSSSKVPPSKNSLRQILSLSLHPQTRHKHHHQQQHHSLELPALVLNPCNLLLLTSATSSSPLP